MKPARTAAAVPVILLTGYLGAGKTTVLNRLLRRPDSRIGVVVNDFGDLNIDAGLVAGQVDDVYSIAGGCLCCLDDDTTLEDALGSLSRPQLGLDVIVVEASGVAEPLILARMVSRMGHHRFHLGGVIDVVDAQLHLDTVDTEAMPPVRYAATTLVLVNKLDRLPAERRERAVAAVRARVHARNPRALVLGTAHGIVDPALLFDSGWRSRDWAERTRGRGSPAPDEGQGELPILDLLRDACEARDADDVRDATGDLDAVAHRHAQSLTVTVPGSVDAAALVDFLEDLPVGVHRVKGVVRVDDGGRRRAFTVQAVGASVYVSTTVPRLGIGDLGTGTVPGAGRPEPAAGTGRPGRDADTARGGDPQEVGSALVVIGEGFDERAVRRAVEGALRSESQGDAEPAGSQAQAGRRGGLERLLTYVRLHS